MATKLKRAAPIVVGSRGSHLALTQTLQVISKLARVFPDLSFELKVIKTKGDMMLGQPLALIGGKGLFVKEIEQAMLRGEIDLAVHSLKDLPTEMPKKLIIGAIPKREDARDVLISVKGQGSGVKRIGTSSLRRKAQILAKWPGVEVVEIRGNLDTRIRKLKEENLDGIVVAAAGVRRLKVDSRKLKVESRKLNWMLPAPGQGALAIECRADDEHTLAIIKELDHWPTRLAVTAERALLFHLGGGCLVPIGAHAKITGREMKLEGVVADTRGSKVLRVGGSGKKEEPEKLGQELARQLIKMGAKKILNGKR